VSADPQIILKVERGGGIELFPVSAFEKMFGISFSQRLECAPRLLEKIIKKTKKLYQKGELSRQQIWFGAYFHKELTESFIPDVVIRYIDPILGWGVFANRAFKKMEFIAEYSGIVRKRKRGDRKNAYCFEYVPVPGLLIDAQEKGGIARYINHSAAPNLLSALATVDFMSRVILIADRPIQKGEQLSYDYGPDYWSCRRSPHRL